MWSKQTELSILERKPLFSNASEGSSDGWRHTCQKHGSLVLAMAWVGIGSQPHHEKISEVFAKHVFIGSFQIEIEDQKTT